MLNNLKLNEVLYWRAEPNYFVQVIIRMKYDLVLTQIIKLNSV